MALSTATVTINLADMLGDEFDARRTKIWVDTNVPSDTIVDTTGNAIRLGSGTVKLGAKSASVQVWTPGAGSNPASWQTYIHVDYPDPGTRTRKVRDFGPFTITGNADLADLIEEQEVPPDYAGQLVAEMTQLRDQQVALAGIDDSDSAQAYNIEYGPLTKAKLSASFAGRGTGTSGTPASLPQLMTALRAQNDAAPATLRHIGLGSSVGVGASLPAAATQAPSARLHARLLDVLDRTGSLDFEFTNGSVNGHTIGEATVTDEDYADAKTAAGGAPTLLSLVYAMNDAGVAQYHAGQTFPNVYNWGKTLINEARADGADVVIFTSPHPHTDRNGWDMPDGVDVTYPEPDTQIPDATAGQSVVSVTSPSGATVPADYRMLRVNQSLRQLGADLGCPVIDVEPYWFDAVAAVGQDALYNTGEVVHPNLLGHQLSYWRAIEDFVLGLERSPVIASRPPQALPFADPTWIAVGSGGAPAFTNSWANKGGGWREAVFTKDPVTNIVRFFGSITGGAADTPAFTFPAGFRPALSTDIPGVGAVTPTGEFYIGASGGGGARVGIAGSFPADHA